ncbi:hypothetical protein M0805_000932 [Coniferiporia weirii]|nr:hypothetical protein M0805_000932 [Coniferiporia weirii]
MHEELFFLIQSYASLAPVSGLTWPVSIPCDQAQKSLIEHLISSKHFQSFPPSYSYQRSFWKWTLENLEGRGEEVDERIYAHYITLLPETTGPTTSLVQPPPPSYVTYIWKNSRRTFCESLDTAYEHYQKCTLFEARTTIENGTTGLRTWMASFVLAEYLIMSCNDILGSSRVLELGSGAGFLGIIVAQLQNGSISSNYEGTSSDKSRNCLYLTDLNEQVLSRCQNNVKLSCNSPLTHSALRFNLLDWCHARDEKRLSGLLHLLDIIDAELILGADLIYDLEIIPSLVAVLKLALQRTPPSSVRSPRKAIIAATLRNERTLATFVDQACGAGLDVEELESAPSVLFARVSSNQPDRAGDESGRVKLFVVTCKTSL